jgi:hypothetical protein
MAGRLDAYEPGRWDLGREAPGMIDRLKFVVLAPDQQLGRRRLPQRGQQLERVAVMRCKFDQIFPLDTTKPRIQAAPARETPGDRDSLLAE